MRGVQWGWRLGLPGSSLPTERCRHHVPAVRALQRGIPTPSFLVPPPVSPHLCPPTPLPRPNAGICVALIYILRAIPRYKRVLSPEAGLALEQRSQRYIALPERKHSEQAAPPTMEAVTTAQGSSERVV